MENTGMINFAQKAFILKDNRLLLIKKSENDPYQANKWEVPGGRIEFGESLTTHIKREVKEEVGIDIEIGDPFDVWTWFINTPKKIQVIAVARICIAKSVNIDLSGQTDSDNIVEARWVDYDKIMNYELINNMIPTMGKFISTTRDKYR
jgi:mutator protein MutT